MLLELPPGERPIFKAPLPVALPLVALLADPAIVVFRPFGIQSFGSGVLTLGTLLGAAVRVER